MGAVINPPPKYPPPKPPPAPPKKDKIMSNEINYRELLVETISTLIQEQFNKQPGVDFASLSKCRVFEDKSLLFMNRLGFYSYIDAHSERVVAGTMCVKVSPELKKQLTENDYKEFTKLAEDIEKNIKSL